MTATPDVLIRVKSDIRLERVGDFLPDGSWRARMPGGGTTLTIRVVEYHVSIDGATTAELFCLVTDLLDHHRHLRTCSRRPIGGGLPVADSLLRIRLTTDLRIIALRRGSQREAQ